MRGRTLVGCGVALLVLGLLVALLGCAPTMKARLQQADAGVHGALKAIDAYENTLYTSHAMCGAAYCVDGPAHKRFSATFLPALEAGKTFHLTIAAWSPTQPVPVDVVKVGAALKAASELLKTIVPAGPQHDQLEALIDAGIAAVNSALVLVLPQQAAEVRLSLPTPAHPMP